jgi:polysaccharide pyruvyl transferase WcaK-like protein
MHGLPQDNSQVKKNDWNVISGQQVGASESLDASDLLKTRSLTATSKFPRIALLTPYTGGNFGDAAIQDALIANLRVRLPVAQFAGICLNCSNFVERHGIEAFPITTVKSPFYGMDYLRSAPIAVVQNRIEAQTSRLKSLSKKSVSWIPGARWFYQKLGASFARMWEALRHWADAYRFTRRQDLLLISGGGQLDDEWGGAWGHPFSLLKWTVLAGIAQIPVVFVSVGAGKITSRRGRWFLSTALRMARYRSYRDKTTKKIAAGLLSDASSDPVVPDLAFSIPQADFPPPRDLSVVAAGRKIIAVSPICFGKPHSWPYENQELYQRYLKNLAEVIQYLIRCGSYVVLISSTRADRQVISELCQLLFGESETVEIKNLDVASIDSWRDLVAALRPVDVLIASRLHSIILGFVCRKPTIALSFDPKIDWVMEDLNQQEYLLPIQDFTVDQLKNALVRIQARSCNITDEIAKYQRNIQPIFAKQYDSLAQLCVPDPGPCN